MKNMYIAAALLWLVSCVHALAQERGEWALPGIDTIPLNAVQLTNEQVREWFMVTDVHNSGSSTIGRARAHAESMRRAACKAYIIACNPDTPVTAPFSFVTNAYEQTLDGLYSDVMSDAARQGMKIVTRSHGPGYLHGFHDAQTPFVLVQSNAVKGGSNFFIDNRDGTQYDRGTDTFIWKDGHVFTRHDPAAADLFAMRDAIAAQRVIYTGEYYLQQGVPYQRSTGCIGAEESCVWMPYLYGATSPQAPRLGAAMASLLAVFPDYDVFDLAALVSTCATAHPTLPGGGAVNVPCMIETMCEETGNQSSACDNVEQSVPIIASVPEVQGLLENPPANKHAFYAPVSGISVISGWICDAETIEIELPMPQGTVRWRAGYNTTRPDTQSACGDSDNGFSLLFNWNLLGDGIHTVRAYADGVLFAQTKVRVTTLGKEMVWGADGMLVYGSFGDFNGFFGLQWEQSLQNFVITDGADPLPKTGFNTTPAVQGYLENPSLSANVSGISAITGWICDAEVVEIELPMPQGTVRWRAGYNTTRTDTQSACGDSDNGFSLLFNWNLLGDGIHTIRAYADNMLFAETKVKVTTFGKEMVWDVQHKASIPLLTGYTLPDTDLWLEWQQTLQNFVIISD